ncbi:hypothetical protein [Pontiella sulfatireligans]|uniref:Uncharacterized protein n=1 Tax=Pontiella sulfatireligans TaxID=2750658 RepID=A0A6C2UHU7_9BACT|nr:hypothetical protein [Pontiella sulfatireligans]VGO19027.1 hypothetical protein SCARR_01082 [Pontiella sulfatireligans]
MNDALKTYIKQYIELESGMQELVLKKCSSLCAQCTSVCCDIVMCVEAIKSPFLKLVHQQADQFDEQNGFLSATGCSLKQGRPSVCYEYFCDNQFYFQPDDLHAEILQTLGALLHHATKDAKSDLPLEDIMQEEDLDLLDFQQLESQMAESLQALDIIRTFYRDGTLTEDARNALKLIQIPEEFDTPAEASAQR